MSSLYDIPILSQNEIDKIIAKLNQINRDVKQYLNTMCNMSVDEYKAFIEKIKTYEELLIHIYFNDLSMINEEKYRNIIISNIKNIREMIKTIHKFNSQNEQAFGVVNDINNMNKKLFL